MPVYVAAIPGIVLTLVQIYREVTDWEGRRGGQGGMDMDEVSDVKLEKNVELKRTVGFFAWFIAGALGIWLLGLVISLPLLIFLYALIEVTENPLGSFLNIIGFVLSLAVRFRPTALLPE